MTAAQYEMKWWFKKKMAEEEKEAPVEQASPGAAKRSGDGSPAPETEASPGEATSSSCQDPGEATSSSCQDSGEATSSSCQDSGEATSSSLQDKEVKKSTRSDEDVASPKSEPEAKPAEVDWKLQYAHLLADFDNYKKRAARDRDDTYRYVESQVLKDLLPTVDNLGLALAKAPKADDDSSKLGAGAPPPPQPQQNTNATFASFVKGVQLVYDGLLKMLKDHDAEPFDSVGQDLDTEKMEAIAHLPSPDIAEGKVSIESKKGWFLKGKVLRPAQVVVSSGKPA